MASLREILNPESVALIGATERENSIGRAVLANLSRTANRPLYFVNPNRQTVLGARCFPSIRDVPSRVTLAVVVTPAATVPGIIEACGKAGVSVAIILSSNFKEKEQRELAENILAARKESGMRTIGPNSLGMILPHNGLNATFLKTNPKPGNIALIAPVLGDAILDWGDTIGIGFSMFASLGSRIDVGYGDLIDFLTYHYTTRSLMIYMETVGDAKRFISAARGFALSKPIVVLKPGRSKAGASFVEMRAGRSTGNDSVYDAVFRRIGIVRVAEVMDLFNMAKVLDSPCLPRGCRLAVITNAGDVGIMATDTLAELGGELACVSSGEAGYEDVLLPEQWCRDDPVDMEGATDARRYRNTLDLCLSDDGVDGIMVIYTPRVFAGAMDLAQAIIQTARKTRKPIIVTWVGGARAAEGRRILLHNNVPAYATPEEAVKTYLYMYRYHRNLELIYETPAEGTQTGAPLLNYLKTVIRKAIRDGKRTLSRRHAFDLIRNYRIRTLGTAIVSDIDQLRREIPGLGLPLSLRIQPLTGEKEEQAIPLTATGDVDDACRQAGQRLRNGGVEVILQKPPAPAALRLKLESRRDPEFRTILVISPGAGGPDDERIGLPPLNRTLARRLLEGAGIYPVLKNADEGRQILSRLEDTLLGFSNLVVDFAEIERMELVLWIEESDVLAGDVTVALTSVSGESAPYSHLVITPYPLHYITTWNLLDGTEVLLRPVRPEDKLMSQAMLDSLSEEALRNRYFGVREITDDLVVRSCNMDYDREIAILAEIRKNGKKYMIGGSRLIHHPDTGIGEFAILVHDHYQGMGLGAKLIDILIGIARDKHLHKIEGLVLTENGKMLGLCRKLGFQVKPEPEGVSKVSLSLET